MDKRRGVIIIIIIIVIPIIILFFGHRSVYLLARVQTTIESLPNLSDTVVRKDSI